LIDTGSDISAVAPTILQQLGAPAYGRGTTSGIGGSVSVRLFKVTILILDASQPQLPWLVRPDVMVMELPNGAPVEVVLGMDVLLTCRTLLDGPALQLVLEF
jgi:Aspartyl protease